MGCLIAVVVYWEYWWPAFPVLVYFKVRKRIGHGLLDSSRCLLGVLVARLPRPGLLQGELFPTSQQLITIACKSIGARSSLVRTPGCTAPCCAAATTAAHCLPTCCLTRWPSPARQTSVLLCSGRRLPLVCAWSRRLTVAAHALVCFCRRRRQSPRARSTSSPSSWTVRRPG